MIATGHEGIITGCSSAVFEWTDMVPETLKSEAVSMDTIMTDWEQVREMAEGETKTVRIHARAASMPRDDRHTVETGYSDAAQSAELGRDMEVRIQSVALPGASELVYVVTLARVFRLAGSSSDGRRDMTNDRDEVRHGVSM